MSHESAADRLVHRDESSAAWRAVDEYFASSLVPEDHSLVVARRSSAGTTMPNAEVTANQGALLGLLAQIAGARRVLEFGTLAGYSTIWFARAVGSDGRVVTLEMEEQNALIARDNVDRAGVGERVEMRVGLAAESAQRLVDERVEPFDLVFIDADKRSNPAYLTLALELTSSGAVIVIDNVVRHGAVIESDSEDPSVQGVRAVTRDIATNPDLDATAIQTVGIKGWDGMIIARRR